MEPTGIKFTSINNEENARSVAILVNYGAISNCNYFRIAADFVRRIGYYLADVLVNRLKIPPENIESFGHSLGAHILAYTGCALNGSIKRITGKILADKPDLRCLIFSLNKQL